MRAIVVADGEAGDGDDRTLEHADLLIAADGGGRWLAMAGRVPDLLVGDLDSLDAASVSAFERAGTRIVRHPPDKDASDTELAVAAAVEAGADEVVILRGLGGPRLDHELANVLLLADEGLRGVDVRLERAGTRVRLVSAGSRLDLEGRPGMIVTLLPLGQPAHGITTRGLRYPLDAGSLPAGGSRGLSNVVESAPASVSVASGMLLVVETEDAPVDPAASATSATTSRRDG